MPEGACTPTVAVVGFQAHNLDPTQAPLLANALYYLGAVALMTGRSETAIRIQLHRHPERFDPPHYTRRRIDPRRRRKAEYRLLTTRDVETLRQLYPIYIRVRRSSPEGDAT